jgi:hypothetical protein
VRRSIAGRIRHLVVDARRSVSQILRAAQSATNICGEMLFGFGNRDAMLTTNLRTRASDTINQCGRSSRPPAFGQR